MVPFLLKKSATPPIYEKIQRKKHDNINGLVGLQVILIKNFFLSEFIKIIFVWRKSRLFC